MRSSHTLAAAGIGAALVIGVTACGNGDTATVAAKAKAPSLPSAAALARDPYSITCGHVRDQLTWAGPTRRATVAIADREPARGLNRLRMTESLFFAMTEICDGKPAMHRPARAAVRGVHSGRYIAGLGAPNTTSEEKP
jgi:hypothetical protein